MVLMERTLKMRRAGEQQLLRLLDVLEVVLRAEPVELVGVRVGARAGVERDLDLLEGRFGALENTFRFPRLRQHQIHDESTLALLGEDVVQVDVLLVVGIAHGLAP